ncbi:MAG: glycosyltransferase family 4 protein [Candidatus Muirbacterium halophilum]|nr:glycosyltransferase family 4 protein [Candidatus Muirbacterium halophilum]
MYIVNCRFLTQRLTGAQRFAVNICLYLKEFSDDFIFVSPKKILHRDIAEKLEVIKVGFFSGYLWEQVELPLYLNKIGNPILLNLVNLAPVFYKKNVITLLDIAWLHYPKSVSKKFYYIYKFIIPIIIKKSLHIFTISNFCLKDISSSFFVSKNKITKIYCGVNHFDCFVQKKMDYKTENEKFILAVSSIQPYKNINNLIEGMKILNKKINIKLYLVGNKNNKVFNKVVIKEYDFVKYTGYVDDETLINYYKNAELFIFPSLFEGFGIPPLEAMSCGCPVLASDLASIPEVCGDAAVYFDPYNIDDIADKIKTVIENEKLQKDLINKGFENIKRFSWEKSAKKIYKTIREIKL